MKRSVVVLAVTAVLVSLVGCKNKCVTLEEKVCTDLGPSDCALWKEKGADKMMLPTSKKGASKVCDVLLDSYPVIIEEQKKIVASYRAAEQLKGSGAKPAASAKH